MIRSRRQMIAIILKMKEKMGKAGLAGRKASPVQTTKAFTKTQIKLGGKPITVHVSNKIKSQGMKKAWSSKAIQSYMKRIPKGHHKDLNIRGIHVLGQGEFSNILGGAALRGSHPKAIDALIQQKKWQEVFTMAPETKALQKAVGLHQNGRIFLNADGMEKAIASVPNVPAWMMRKGSAQNVLLHEAGHHYDGNKARFIIEATGFRQPKATQQYRRSQMPSMLEKLVGKSKFADETEDILLRTQAIEGYANLYNQYAVNPLLLKRTNPAGYNIMKEVFQERVPRLTKQIAAMSALPVAGVGVGTAMAIRRRRKEKKQKKAR